eukprot:3190445-Rhodomonas_salina.1
MCGADVQGLYYPVWERMLLCDVRYCPSVCCYAMLGTDATYDATGLVRHAAKAARLIAGADMEWSNGQPRYAPTRFLSRVRTDLAYAATRCLVPRRMHPLGYALRYAPTRFL